MAAITFDEAKVTDGQSSPSAVVDRLQGRRLSIRRTCVRGRPLEPCRPLNAWTFAVFPHPLTERQVTERETLLAYGGYPGLACLSHRCGSKYHLIPSQEAHGTLRQLWKIIFLLKKKARQLPLDIAHLFSHYSSEHHPPMSGPAAILDEIALVYSDDEYLLRDLVRCERR